MRSFVLEIGSEEVPARFLDGEMKFVSEAFSKALGEEHLGFEEIFVHATPRRLVVHITKVADTQEVREEVVSGPAVRIAYDDKGNPTKALAGFLRGQGATVDELFTLETEKGSYVAFKRTIGGKTAKEILALVTPTIIAAIPFAKRMRWGAGSFAYARPMHWILALLDDEVVPITIGDVASDRLTCGHRIHGPGPFSCKDCQEYFTVLEKQGAVVLDARNRRNTIVAKGDELAKAVSGSVLWSEKLLCEVEGLVEHPFPILGHFDAGYLEVPREVLLTSMETHQKSFGLQDEQGNLLPYFLTVSNLEPEDASLIQKGWERVLHARLEDARFFWREDLKVSFDTWLAKLDSVIFMGGLGSMGEKTRRLEALCGWIAKQLGAESAVVTDASRAGRLSKADLVSGMVGEFDTLQGIMGGIYAKEKGESDAVAAALQEQYLPQGPESPLPKTIVGAILAIADKADTLAGSFGLNKVPTGAADPFALRRCALGILRIMTAFGFTFSVRALFVQAQSLYGERNWKVSREKAIDMLMDFLAARVEHLLGATHTVQTVAAIVHAGIDPLPDVQKRLEALLLLQKDASYIENVQVLKRIGNILQKVDPATIPAKWKREDLATEAEANLAQSLEHHLFSLAQDDYTGLVQALTKIRPFVDAFFAQVMVMSEDPKERKTRLSLLSAIARRYAQLADFSALQV